MRRFKIILVIFAALSLSACNSTHFESTWQDPSVHSLDLRKEALGAYLLSGNQAVRLSFEQHFANELNERGIEAIPGYELTPETDVTDKSAVLRDLKGTQVDHAIFMRMVDRQQEVSYVPGSAWYPSAYYDPFYWRYGDYLGPGSFYAPFYDPGYYRVDTVVSVETLVYSVPDSKLLWAGTSKTMNPSKVPGFVEDLVSEAVKAMEKTGVVGKKA
jgi:hypothetical protein